MQANFANCLKHKFFALNSGTDLDRLDVRQSVPTDRWFVMGGQWDSYLLIPPFDGKCGWRGAVGHFDADSVILQEKYDGQDVARSTYPSLVADSYNSIEEWYEDAPDVVDETAWILICWDQDSGVSHLCAEINWVSLSEEQKADWDEVCPVCYALSQRIRPVRKIFLANATEPRVRSGVGDFPSLETSKGKGSRNPNGKNLTTDILFRPLEANERGPDIFKHQYTIQNGEETLWASTKDRYRCCLWMAMLIQAASSPDVTGVGTTIKAYNDREIKESEFWQTMETLFINSPFDSSSIANLRKELIELKAWKDGGPALVLFANTLIKTKLLLQNAKTRQYECSLVYFPFRMKVAIEMALKINIAEQGEVKNYPIRLAYLSTNEVHAWARVPKSLNKMDEYYPSSWCSVDSLVAAGEDGPRAKEYFRNYYVDHLVYHPSGYVEHDIFVHYLGMVLRNKTISAGLLEKTANGHIRLHPQHSLDTTSWRKGTNDGPVIVMGIAHFACLRD
jgi:hypothetical protein